MPVIWLQCSPKVLEFPFFMGGELIRKLSRSLHEVMVKVTRTHKWQNVLSVAGQEGRAEGKG